MYKNVLTIIAVAVMMIMYAINSSVVANGNCREPWSPTHQPVYTEDCQKIGVMCEANCLTCPDHRQKTICRHICRRTFHECACQHPWIVNPKNIDPRETCESVLNRSLHNCDRRNCMTEAAMDACDEAVDNEEQVCLKLHPNGLEKK
ncbi:MAG: hypothetical protein K2P93_03545 [Alphaproteobacteria bacterium]|nr:hypothetical protein [Alphaproteobacteria bacterium]